MARKLDGFYDVSLGDAIEDINDFEYAMDSTIVVPFPYPPKHQFFYVLKTDNLRSRQGSKKGSIICIKRVDGRPEFREVVKIDGNCLILDSPMNKLAQVGGSVTRVLGESTHYVNRKATEMQEKAKQKFYGKVWV